MQEDPMREALIEAEQFNIYSKWLKEHKGVDMSPIDCYDMLQWFKNPHDDIIFNPTQSVIYLLGKNIANHFMLEWSQMNQLYELYYILKCGVAPLGNKLKI